jgi:hypothetical protein
MDYKNVKANEWMDGMDGWSNKNLLFFKLQYTLYAIL